MKVRFFNKTYLWFWLIFLLILSLRGNAQTILSREDSIMLKVITGLHYTFKHYQDKIWPGYDLSKTPYVIYLPDKWVLYVNGDHPPRGFQKYPASWPPVDQNVFVHEGKYGDLVGQFVFNLRIDSIRTFAMGIPTKMLFSFDHPEYVLFSTTAHEGFHQYQHLYFGEIPWRREEKYPILNVENTALSSLELLILKDGLRAMFEGDTLLVRESLKQFLAVRTYRWRHMDPFIREYEQGQEINEGTARFVEMKTVACFKQLDSITIHNSLLNGLMKDMSDISVRKLMSDDIESKLTGKAVAPDNMLRNRIYPVGASLGFMFDFLGIPWKETFRKAGNKVSFPGLLMQYFKPDTQDLKEWFAKAKKDYAFSTIRSASGNLINKYLAGYQHNLDSFNHQKGYRIEINLSFNGLTRSRFGTEKRWVMEKGRVILCKNYDLYLLKGKNISLEIRGKAVLEKNDWENRRRNVSVYTDKDVLVAIDGKHLRLSAPRNGSFRKIKISAAGFKLQVKQEGSFRFDGKVLKIYLMKNLIRSSS